MINEPNNEILEVIIKIANELRSEGHRIGVSDTAKAYQLAEAYKSITGKKELGKDEIELIILSSFTTANLTRDKISELVSRVLSGRGFRKRINTIISDIEKDIKLLGIRPGVKVSKRKIIKNKDKKEAIAAYYRLKRIGAIKGKPGQERLADKSYLKKLATRLALAGVSNLDEAVRKMKTPKRWDTLLDAVEAQYTPEKLGGLSENELIRLAKAAEKKHDKETMTKVAEELARRIKEGAKIRNPEAIADILRKTDLLTNFIRRKLIIWNPDSLASIPKEDLLKVLAGQDAESGGIILARTLEKMNSSEAKEIIPSVDPRLLWALPRSLLKRMNDKSLLAAHISSRALRESLRYLETGDEGRGDMAYDLLKRAVHERNSLPPSYTGLVKQGEIDSMIREAESYISLAESLVGEPRGELIQNIIYKLDYVESIRVLRNIYRRTTNTEWRKIIIKNMEHLLYRLSSREGLRLLPVKYRSKQPPGRIDVKRSIFSMIRNETRPIVYLRRMKSSRLSMAIDMSGSMLEYSSWAVAIASLFPNHLDRLVLFSHETRVYSAPIGKRELAKILLEADFQGYTNISLALRTISTSSARKIVVISDLKQTIDDEPVPLIVSDLVKNGKRVVFITPVNYDEDIGREIIDVGGKLIIARTPRVVARELLRLFTRA